MEPSQDDVPQPGNRQGDRTPCVHLAIQLSVGETAQANQGGAMGICPALPFTLGTSMGDPNAPVLTPLTAPKP